MTGSVISALALASLIGVSLGALGSGSILAMPILVYVGGIAVPTAIGMSLSIVGGTALIGAYLHYRRGQLHSKATLIFALTGVVGAYLGSSLTHRVAPHILMLLFALLLLVVGALMLQTGKVKERDVKCQPARCLIAGAAVGGLTGFLGVGGGFLIVPALILLAGLEAQEAVGTSLAIIALNSSSGLVGHARYGEIDLWLTLGFLIMALAGVKAGMGIAGLVSERIRRKAFGWLLVAMSLVMGAMNLEILLG
jgi:uncharacterized membrane protein YfcA